MQQPAPARICDPTRRARARRRASRRCVPGTSRVSPAGNRSCAAACRLAGAGRARTCPQQAHGQGLQTACPAPLPSIGTSFAFDVAPRRRVYASSTRSAPPVALCDPERLDDLPGRLRSTPDVAHVAVTHQLVERAHRLLIGRAGSRSRDLVRSMCSSCSQPFVFASGSPSRRRECGLWVAPRCSPPGPVRAETGSRRRAVARDLPVLQARLPGDLPEAVRRDTRRVSNDCAGIERGRRSGARHRLCRSPIWPQN